MNVACSTPGLVFEFHQQDVPAEPPRLDPCGIHWLYFRCVMGSFCHGFIDVMRVARSASALFVLYTVKDLVACDRPNTHLSHVLVWLTGHAQSISRTACVSLFAATSPPSHCT